MLDNLRIIKIKDCYFVEQKVISFYFFTKWIPFITWSGVNQTYPFSSFDSALEATLLKIKYKLIESNN